MGATVSHDDRAEMASLRIGQVARQAGVSTRALRYYEEQRLLQPERTPSGQRVYPVSAVARVRLIQELFAAGLSSTLLVTLLPAIDARHVTPDLSRRLLTENARLKSQIAQLQAAERRLAALVGLIEHPHDATCPSTLDDPYAGNVDHSGAPIQHCTVPHASI